MECALKTKSLAWIVDVLSHSDGLLVRSNLGGREEHAWVGAAIDSRAECSGRLFFALKGENTDGHLYIKDAFSAGCAAAVIDDRKFAKAAAADGIPFLLVSNCLEALQKLAWAYRRCLEARVIAITGSTGKTSTKEYIRQIVRSKFRVFSNPGNYNNLIGVPLTILETESDHEYLVCEVGANQMGEIEFLSNMLEPDIGVITNIGDAHVGMFGSVDNIARAKGEILDSLKPSGCAVLPKDDAYIAQLTERSKSKVVTFGLSTQSDFVVSDVQTTDQGLSFTVNGEPFDLRALGEYNAINATAACAVGELCGIGTAAIRKALQEITPMPGRGRIHHRGGVVLIDESYNASPASVRVSLTTLERVGADRRVAVLGDMMELGDFSRAKHEELGGLLAQRNIDLVFWLGSNGELVEANFIKSGGDAPFHVHTDLNELVDQAAAEIRPRDAVLVKASRACNLDQFVTRFLERLDTTTES
jgi:UDP-N-acetylmuramoyl-tripeptide--D-alanyl-D-alanine ligase